MNKTLFSAVLAVAALSPFAAKADDVAAGNQTNNFFVTGNLGQSNYRVGGLSDKSDVFQSVRDAVHIARAVVNNCDQAVAPASIRQGKNCANVCLMPASSSASTSLGLDPR